MKRNKLIRGESPIGSNEDRKLAFSFGGVILALMLIITGVAMFLFGRLQQIEEDRLSAALAVMLSESINRVSFSGKYHARLFVEEMKTKVSAVDFISVEAFDGTIIANSDSSLNDTKAGSEEILLGREALKKNNIINIKHKHNGKIVKEIIIPFRSGLDSEVTGIVRLGINIDQARREKIINFLKLFMLITILTSGSIWIVFILSKYFGRRVRDLALQMMTIVDNSPALIYMKDYSGRYMFINRRWAELFNTTNEDVRGKKDIELFSPEIAAGFIANDRFVMDNDELLEIEEYAPHADGIHTYQSIKVAIKDSDGKIYALLGISTDITEKKKSEDALRASEERFKNLVEQSPFSILIMDNTGRTVQINDAFKKLWGISMEDLAVYNIFEDKQLTDLGMMELIKKVFNGEAVQLPVIQYDSGKTLGKGSKRWTKANIYPVKDGTGKIRDVVLIHDDITEQRQAEEALRDSEEIFRHFMENSPIYIFFKDENIRPVRLSRNYEQMLGMPLDKIIGKKMSEIFPPEIAQPMEDDDRRILQNGEIVTVEEELNDRNYTTIKFPIAINGKIRYLAGYTIDITERKQAERLIDDERERLLVTLRSIGDAVITTDVDSKIILMNRIAEELTGWPALEARDHNLMEVFSIIHEITREPGENPAERVIEGGNIIELPQQTILINRNGGERLISDSCAPIRGSDNAIIGTVLVFRDITEKRKTDTLLQNSQKLESLGVLAGGIAHDFNNLLSGIFGYLELMKLQMKSDSIEKIESTLNKAMQVFGRTKALTQQLLTFARGGEPHKKNIEISRILKTNTEFVLSGTRVTSRFSIQQGLWQCFADEYQIAQVLDNIIINAVQAMPEGGEISIRAENYFHNETDSAVLLSAGRYVRLIIQDQGSGISSENISRIFDPFYTTKPAGTGLGLATSYSIIKRHGGAISAESVTGRGSIFTLYIPAADDDETNNAESQNDEIPELKGRVLIMDDEDFMRQTASAILESMGISSDTAADGDEAVSKYIDADKAGNPFSAVILDLTVKGGSGGKKALEKLLEYDPGIKAIASSGYSADPVMASPEKFGFQDRLIKPYRIDELIKVLNSLYRKK